MKVLVSGGAGLVGRYIVNDFLSAGDAVSVGGRREPAAGHFSRSVGFVPMVLDPAVDQASAFNDIDVFIHAAFDHLPGKYRGGEGDNPDGFVRANLDGSVALFSAARKAGVRHCLFLSSRAVYDGYAGGWPLSEALSLAPSTLYGDVKLRAEQALADLSGPDFLATSLRLTGVYGDLKPNKWDALFEDYFNDRPVAARAGSEVHGCDVAQAVRLIMAAAATEVSCQSFNVSDIVTDSSEILSFLQAQTGCQHPVPTPADRDAVAAMATDKIRALGWLPGGRALLAKTVRALARS
ncbi:MAG: NAD-dependent epimerase/dehydratase family protein [Allorhizobium sp.]